MVQSVFQKNLIPNLLSLTFFLVSFPISAFDWNASFDTDEEAQAAFSKSFKFKKGDRVQFLKKIVLAENNPLVIESKDAIGSLAGSYLGCAVEWAEGPYSAKGIRENEQFIVQAIIPFKQNLVENLENGFSLILSPANPHRKSAVSALSCKNFYDIDDLEYTGAEPFYKYKNFDRSELDALMAENVKFIAKEDVREKIFEVNDRIEDLKFVLTNPKKIQEQLEKLNDEQLLVLSTWLKTPQKDRVSIIESAMKFPILKLAFAQSTDLDEAQSGEVTTRLILEGPQSKVALFESVSRLDKGESESESYNFKFH